jgi:HAD superfamily hydrolase (TIGR01484 family)
MSMITPAPLTELTDDRLRAVRWLLFDVDDTVTWQGKLPEVAAGALYRAAEAGLSLVAVTGRSASWAELILRLFPLDAAIAETGAMCLYKADGERVRTLHAEPDEAKRRDNDARRLRAADRVRAEVASARLALDNMGRVYDTAFDLVEDGPAIGEEDAARMRAILAEEGLTVAQSSVHINAWIGVFDKATMVRRYFTEVRGTSLDDEPDRALYAGDSKNDAAMFAAVPLSVGVANIRPHLDWLQERGQAPAYITARKGGFGFSELVDALLRARR